MTPLPPKEAIVGFFGSEPTLQFPEEETWEYNHLTFELRTGKDLLLCEMEPAEMIFNLRWIHDNEDFFQINIKTAWDLRTEETDLAEALLVRFSDAEGELRIEGCKGSGLFLYQFVHLL